jgi:hypothetical protein
MVSFVPGLTKMRKRLHKLLFYTLLLGVYGIFFSVESFYNFEGQTNAGEILRFATLARVQQQHVASARSTPFHPAFYHGIRLNKRFHREVVPSCPLLSPTRPEYALTPLTRVCYRPAGLAEPTLLYRPQRGPPFEG